ncbi:aminotransferase class V-fold PLP-dependent enzyme [Thermobrachium celere]|uniref:cysteine desulfurase n=1 Tax=Thermobrachium celere DSM 8682 TaxID=941824 RepID=R7RR06_9CLOT|nr:aminotransferase class V-fold PLP-dependent enzyme [Thermobrachium celere]CDF57786.1 Cysteine desulfurase [Thermobrachium celere DSM 8682]
MKKVYLDNAATTYPKPKCVSDAVYDFIENIGSNVGRGSYENSYSAAQVVYETRELLCNMFNYDNPLSTIFTMNITQSINMILKGFLKAGDHVLVSSMEHNAVMRPLNSLKKIGVEYTKIPCDIYGQIIYDEVEKLIRPNTKLAIISHASNVCGTMQDIERLGSIFKKHNIYFVIDSAQTAGIFDIDFKRANLSALCFTGHKGLLGPQGIGGFIITPEFSSKINPLIEGGTGSLSESEEQPEYLPDKFESGTLCLPVIYGLNASLKYIEKETTKAIREKELHLTKIFIDGIKNIDEIRLIGYDNIHNRAAVVSIDFLNKDNSEVAFLLDREYGIMTRVGLHCAPSAHKTLNTFPKGTVRFSFGHMNTEEEVKYTLDAIYKICKL